MDQAEGPPHAVHAAPGWRRRSGAAKALREGKVPTNSALIALSERFPCSLAGEGWRAAAGHARQSMLAPVGPGGSGVPLHSSFCRCE